MRSLRFGLISFAAAAAALAQEQSAVLSAADALKLAVRSQQLIESTAAAVPGLSRASAPLVENVRQATARLDLTPGHAGATSDLLAGLRAYLALADATPKPFPFPETAAKQFVELREGVDRFGTHFRALLDQKETALRSPDRDNLRRYAEANSRVDKPAPGRPRVVFMGDSITDGWRLNEYFPERDFVNRGISGQITGEMLGRMKADVVDLKPEAMIVLAGTNDLARGVPVETIRNNLTMIADLAEFHKIRVLLASILPVSDYHKDKNPRFEMTPRRPPEKIRELNAWMQGLAKQRGFTYVDYYAALVDSAGFLNAEYADDGLHPNSAGYRVMAPVAQQAIDGVVRGVVRPAKAEPPPKKKKKGFFAP
jgi:lysophospholipase L1-like esterase